MNIAVVNILIRTNLPIDLHIVLAAPRALAANRDKMVLIERPNERRRLSQPLYKTGYGLFRESPWLITYLPTHNGRILDRKSTRLNSSHANISYAVFCLKKKK